VLVEGAPHRHHHVVAGELQRALAAFIALAQAAGD